MAFDDYERWNIADGMAADAGETVAADGHVVIHDDSAGKSGMVLNDDSIAKHGSIGHGDAIAQLAAFADVAAGHQKIVIANGRAGRTGIYGCAFTNNVVVANVNRGTRWRSMRRFANDGSRKNMIGNAERCLACHGDMIFQPAAVADANLRANDAEGADLHARSDFGMRIDGRQLGKLTIHKLS